MVCYVGHMVGCRCESVRGAGKFYMGEYCGFSPRQAEYVKRSLGSWLNVAEGGKRAGKNVLNVIGFSICLEEHRDKLHLAAGVTLAAARMNILDCNGLGLLNYFQGRCKEGKYEGKQALFVYTDKGEKVVIMEGGGKANDAARIKGHSFGSVYVTEANELHRSFFFEVLDRTLASSERRLFFDLNPKAPGHWFYREFLDRQEELWKKGCNKGFNYGHFTIWDNMSVTEEKLKEALRSYDRDSGWFLTEILGKREGGAGRVYAGFNGDMVLDRKGIEGICFIKMGVGVDVGGTDATVATLVGITREKEVVLVDGYYHKQGRETGYTHDRYAREIGERIAEWGERFPPLFFEGGVFCESADKLFRQALSKELRRRGIGIGVFPSYKRDGIIDRIRLVCMLMNQKRFFICRGMDKWMEALYGSLWDEKALTEGEWVRKDDGSVPVDCLDSMEYGIVPFKKDLV